MKKFLLAVLVCLMILAVVQPVSAAWCYSSLSVQPVQVIRGDAVKFSGNTLSYTEKGIPRTIDIWETPRIFFNKQPLVHIGTTKVNNWVHYATPNMWGGYSFKYYPTHTAYYKVTCTIGSEPSMFSNIVKVTVIDPFTRKTI